MTSPVYEVLKKALPLLPEELQIEATAAITQYERTVSVTDTLGLTATEMLLWQALSQVQGACVSYETLLEVSGIKTVNALWVHKNRLNKKLVKAGYTISRKLSVNGNGYLLDEISN